MEAISQLNLTSSLPSDSPHAPSKLPPWTPPQSISPPLSWPSSVTSSPISPRAQQRYISTLLLCSPSFPSSSDFGTLLRVAHDRPCLRWALALTCTRPLSVWRDKVHLDDLVEERNSHTFTRTSVLLQRLASTNSLCNKHLVKVLGAVERSKSYSTGGCGLLLLLGVLGVYAGMMAISYHFASNHSLLAAKLSLAVFYSQMLTGLFSTYDRTLSDETGQRQLHPNRLFARIRHASLMKPSPSPSKPRKVLPRTAGEEGAPVASVSYFRSNTASTVNFYLPHSAGGNIASDTSSPQVPSAFAIFPALFKIIYIPLYWIHTHLILSFPSLIQADDLESPHDEDIKTDIAIEAKIAGWTASFMIPLTPIEDDLNPDPVEFTKYRYTFTNMARVRPGPEWLLGLLVRLIRWLRLEWILILGQLTAWGAIVTGPLRASLWIGLTQLVGTLLVFAGVYFVTLGDLYKDDRILAAFRLADPELARGVFSLSHEVARTIWNDIRDVVKAQRRYKKVMEGKNSTLKERATIEYQKEINAVIERYPDFAVKHKKEIESNRETQATCSFFFDWLIMSRDEYERIDEEVESWAATVAYDRWSKMAGAETGQGDVDSANWRRVSDGALLIPNPYYQDQLPDRNGSGQATTRSTKRNPVPLRSTTAPSFDNIERPLASTTTQERSASAPRRPRTQSSATQTSADQLSFNTQASSRIPTSSLFNDSFSTRRRPAKPTSTPLPESSRDSEEELTYKSDSSRSSSPPITSTQQSDTRPRTKHQVNFETPYSRFRRNSFSTLGQSRSQLKAPGGDVRTRLQAGEEAKLLRDLRKMEEGTVKAASSRLGPGGEVRQESGGEQLDLHATSTTTRPSALQTSRFPRQSALRQPASLDTITGYRQAPPLPSPLPATSFSSNTSRVYPPNSVASEEGDEESLV